MLYIPNNLSDITEEKSNDYVVTVNGEECFVHSCRVSAIPFNTIWPGHQRPKEQSEPASFISFYSDEAVTLKIKCARSFKKATVRPISKNIVADVNGDEVGFTLTENGSYTLELDAHHFALHIFFNKPKENVDKEKATYYFGPGVHMPLLITLKDNESVYVDPEAIVYATVHADGAKNVRIFGGGIIEQLKKLGSSCYWGETLEIGLETAADEYKNINVYTDEGMDPIKLSFGSYSAEYPVADVTIEDVYINGKRADSLDEFRMVRLENLKNVTLNGMELKG